MKKIILLVLTILLLSSCFKNPNIIAFNEASGICFDETDNSFYAVSDEWEIQKIDTNLKKIWYFKFKKNYDFESIICEKNNLFATNEKTWEILKIDKQNFEILEKYKINWYKLEEKWIEGFSKIWENKYVISTQSKKIENLLFLEFSNNKFKVIKKINFPYKDLSWLEYYQNFLYILSDKNDKIYKYDLKKEKIIDTINLQKWAREGISFDKNWNIFLADDNWRIVKI